MGRRFDCRGLTQADEGRASRGARLCRRARVTGVALFDFLHGQTGVARNGIELHPVLAFVCLRS
jgi:hypothetical protein